MKAILKSRLKRLELKRKPVRRSVIQMGVIKRLPDDFTGEKHVVVSNPRLVDPFLEYCDFEEQPGPAPRGGHDEACKVFVTEDDLLL